MNRSDFKVTANSRGYQVQYKGHNIGGAGVLASAKVPRGKKAMEQIYSYIKCGEYDIDAIVNGHGRKDMLETIAKLDSEGINV